MNFYLKIGLMSVALILSASTAMAQAPGGGATKPVEAAALSLSALAAGIVILGAGYGIGKIGSAAVESMSRQPEAAGNIQTAMLISAALIEGATFFGLIVCIIK